MKKISKWLVVLLLSGLVLRIFIVSWSLQFRENTDVLRYKDWARIAFLHGFPNTYEEQNLSFGTLPNNQPPGSVYVLSAFYNLELQAAKIIFKITHTSPENNMWVNGPLVTIFLRLPSIISDLILGIFIYFFIKRFSSQKSALLGSGLFLLTPPVWYNSSFWGQMDAVNNLIFFISIFLLYKNKYLLAILFSFFSLYIKISLLPLVPLLLYAIFMRNKKNWKSFTAYILISAIAILLLTLPISRSNIFWISEFFKNNSLGEMQNITNFAFNFWWFIFHPSIISGDPKSLFSFSEIIMTHSPLAVSNYLFIPLQTLAFIFFFLFCVPILKKITTLKEKVLHPQNLMLIFCLLCVISFLFLPRMHERYLYPLFPLLAVVVGLSGKYLKTFILLSVLNFINLYIVWHPMKLAFLPYEIINNSNFQWFISLGVVIIGLLFYYNVLRHGLSYEKNK